MRVERPTAANFYLRKFRELAMAVDMEIPPALDATETGRIAATELGRIVQAICDHTQDESMGLANHPVPRGAFFTMAKLAILEPNLGRALIAGNRFMRLLSDVATPQLKRHDGLTSLQFQFVSHRKDRHHLFAELALMSWHRLACWLIAKNIPLECVHFEYPPPEQIDEYDYLFPGEHKFHQTWSGFSFNRELLDEATVRDYDSLKVFMRDNPVALFLQPKVDSSLAVDIERLMKHRNRSGALPSIDDAAASVHVSRRTLIRRLKKEGTSYQSIKDSVRQERALDLLASRDITISEVAESVGFVDAATFSRAFKIWTGKSPSDYRVRIGTS